MVVSKNRNKKGKDKGKEIECDVSQPQYKELDFREASLPGDSDCICNICIMATTIIINSEIFSTNVHRSPGVSSLAIDGST